MPLVPTSQPNGVVRLAAAFVQSITRKSSKKSTVFGVVASVVEVVLLVVVDAAAVVVVVVALRFAQQFHTPASKTQFVPLPLPVAGHVLLQSEQ